MNFKFTKLDEWKSSEDCNAWCSRISTVKGETQYVAGEVIAHPLSVVVKPPSAVLGMDVDGFISITITKNKTFVVSEVTIPKEEWQDRKAFEVQLALYKSLGFDKS